MVDRAHRLRQQRDFDRLRQVGWSYRHPLVRLQVVPNNLPITRVGIIVGKRVAARAHERNLVKRRLRELSRARLATLPCGYDVLIIAQSTARGATFGLLAQALDEVLRRARLPIPRSLETTEST